MSVKTRRFGYQTAFDGVISDARDTFVFWEDFLGTTLSATDDAASFDIAVGTGTAVICDATDAEQEMAGGLVLITVQATASDVVSLIANGESFNVDAGYPLYFEARFMEVDVSATQLFIGLAQTDTSCIAALGNGIGFLGSGTNTLSTSVALTTANVDDTGIDLADGDWYRVAFYYDGDNTVTFYVKRENDDWQEVNSLKLDVTADYVCEDIMMTPHIEVENGSADGSADFVYVDYVLAQQVRCWAPE